MDYEKKIIEWKPLSEYNGGRVIATNDLDILIGEINSDGDCISEDDDSILLCGITAFANIGDILPRLKESEDERIKKALICYITDYSDGCSMIHVNGVTRNEAIAWLEKQGEQSIYKVPSREVIFAIGNLGNEWRELTNGCISTEHGTQLDYIQKHWKESEYYLKAKQDEQTSADKTEPKFHDGDWIVYNDNIYHIGNISLKGYYECLRIDGTIHTFGFSIDNKSHLWTIQDAKDGDVLVEDSCIFIIEKLNHDHTAETYCELYNDGCFDDCSSLCFDIDSTKPATKEQRDTLFKKMKEAGYTFDFDKKELKKIEQKIVELSEQDKRYINLFEYALKNTFPSTDNPHRAGAVEWLNSLKDRIIWKPSEEQMNALDSTLQYSQVSYNSFEHLNSLFNDLKKLREE